MSSAIGALLAALVALTSPVVVFAQSLTPSALPAGPGPESSAPTTAPWPTGDELRRELQLIGFGFRVDGSSGDWLGWAPRALAGEAPALGLGGAGTRDAIATFDFDLLGGDAGVPLTAYMEVTARLPLEPADVEQARRFIVDDLLAESPQTLEACYVTDWTRGAALATVDPETGAARVRVGSTVDALETVMDPGLDLAECAPLAPAEVIAAQGAFSTERLTIGISGEPLAFDPAEVSLEGALVTLVLTFRNDSAAEQTLTFEAPLDSSTGPVAPGAVKLIVVRQVEPGEYPFYSEADPDGLRGVIRIEVPTPD